MLGTCIVRKLFDYIFEQRELKWLDDLMPEDKKMAKEDQEMAGDGEVRNIIFLIIKEFVVFYLV